MVATTLHPALSDPVIGRIKADLRALYGDRLKRVILYGSRARGDHRPDSDYDLIAILNGPIARSAERDRLVDVFSPYLWRDEIEIHVQPFEEHDLQKRTIFMYGVREEGVDV